MKKTIVFGIVAICLLLSVYALSEGDILTQEQVDNANLDTINLQCQWEVQDFTIDIHYLKVPFSCLSIRQEWEENGDDYSWTGDYIVFRKPFMTKFSTKILKACVQQYNLDACLSDGVKPELKSQAKEKIYAHRQSLKRFQNADIPMISGNDIGLTGGVEE